MTIRQLALRLLRYIGVTNLDPSENSASLLRRGLDENDLEEVCTAINGALQELFDSGPSVISERPMGGVLRPPGSITFSATQYSTTISAVSGFADWMLGCTVRVSGDALDNRLLSATELLRPYTAGTGTVSAAVYCDCIPLPATVRNVLDPVEIPNNARLWMAASYEEFRSWNGASTAPLQRSPATFYNTSNKATGEPIVAFVDSVYTPGSEGLQSFLRVNPMPIGVYPVSFRVKLKAPTVTPADLDNGDHSTDPLSSIPVDYLESTVLPFALQRFSAHPSFSATGTQLQEIGRQYQRAQDGLVAAKPQISRTRGMYLPG